MLPWNYGFHADLGHLVFLGAFYAVLLTVAVTLARAALRSLRDLRARRAEQIRWQSDFQDLPARDRVCRHVLTGEFAHRECPNAFDCRVCSTHAKLIETHPAAAAAEEQVLGMSFPRDRLYHRGHCWVRPEQDGTVTVGLDDLAARLLASPEHVDLPPAGARLEVNGTALRVRKQGAEVRVLSPVEGEVIACGAPAGSWYLKVRPAQSGEPAFRHLLRGAEVRPWVMREMERLQLALRAGGAAPSLADGGVPVADIAKACPEADWDAVCGEMFLEN